jgi:hypothetical protein
MQTQTDGGRHATAHCNRSLEIVVAVAGEQPSLPPTSSDGRPYDSRRWTPTVTESSPCRMARSVRSFDVTTGTDDGRLSATK